MQKLILDDGTTEGVVVLVVKTDHGNRQIVEGPETLFPSLSDESYSYNLCNNPGVGDHLEVSVKQRVLGTLMPKGYFHTPLRVRVNDTITV